MKKTIMFLLSGVLAIALFSCPVIASVSVNFCEYLPLSVGNKWTYVGDSSKLYYTEIIGTEIINGEFTYQMQAAHVTDYDYVNFKCEAGIAKVVGFDGVALESPIYIDGIDLETSENKVLYSIEPQVVTPAGTFTNVIKIERYDLNEKMGRLYLDQEEYVAKGVGTIKSVGYFVHDSVNPGSYENTYLLQLFNLLDGWETINGTVTHNGTPLCAMVLANGQYMFSCGENQGIYELEIPLDENGEITLFAFVDGLAPFKQILTPLEALDFDIEMELAGPDSKMPTVTRTVPESVDDPPGWVKFSGFVSLDGMPLNAMILANGQYMFSSGEQEGLNIGDYELVVPLDQGGMITLFVFVDGLQPYKEIFSP